MNELIYGKVVQIESKGIDRYERTLGVVWIDKININEELLKNGLAWHYTHFDKSAEYAKLEQDAKARKINIWSMKNPVAPWEFRKK